MTRATRNTVDRICPYCGSSEIFVSSSSPGVIPSNAIFSIAGAGRDGRPAYECRKCGGVFETPVEIFQTGKK